MRTRIFFPIVSSEIDRAPAAARTQKNGPRPGVGQRAVWAVLFNLPTERTAGRRRHLHSRSLLNEQRVIGGPSDRLAGQHLHHMDMPDMLTLENGREYRQGLQR